MRRIFGEALIDEPAQPIDGRFNRIPLIRVESKDGVPLEFNLQVDTQKKVPTSSLEIGDIGSVPLKAVRGLGRGDTTVGLRVLALQAAALNIRNLRPGSANPLMEACVIPFYGGKDRFDAAMGAV